MGGKGFGVFEMDDLETFFFAGNKLSKSLFISPLDGGLHLFIWSFFCRSRSTDARKPYPNRWFDCMAEESLDERTLFSICITEGL